MHSILVYVTLRKILLKQRRNSKENKNNIKNLMFGLALNVKSELEAIAVDVHRHISKF